ncbi:hypothetical protein HMPREF9943_00182 [Eggerthia catenaformis OT 569 = DSM 20559]|uniref:Uncharacterized protein n=1 Tax=Eggerthia catenaformis OT 569 = DSM 20559 TaxID=999415 RepID=M2Q3B9_9FIRM|nr:hypothetical protein [Eggerthia catenaformis]EMD17395.1 hypothetical protein HMPREF9943_00182 [Eggerthia catenaformis OT 569 = DSM 20559]
MNKTINNLDRWTFSLNCSYFAAKVWNSVAKTQLSCSSSYASMPLPQVLAQSIKKNLTYYTTNRKIESNGRDYLYYHTSSHKTQCKYPKFNILNPLTKSKFIEKDNINITERRYTTSFPRDFEVN